LYLLIFVFLVLIFAEPRVSLSRQLQDGQSFPGGQSAWKRLWDSFTRDGRLSKELLDYLWKDEQPK
jgi:hypothetical protein